MISKFRGEYFFLSNFYPCRVIYKRRVFSSSEAAFQSEKCMNNSCRENFLGLTALEAKKLGRTLLVRADWDVVKDEIMYKVLLAKFADVDLELKLLRTYPQHIEEGNTWNDTYWGVCNGKGQNKLGKLLMRIRDEKLSGKTYAQVQQIFRAKE